MVVLLASILTFFVGTMIPIIKPLIKLNGVMQKNTDAIDALNKTVNELAVNNKKEHDHFHKDINNLKIDVGTLKVNHEKDVQMLGLNIKKG
ncbi:hypothetical protein ACQQ4G_003149 [Listeria monocytogenes]